jgi:uncharacterized protein (TIGR02246 family)
MVACQQRPAPLTDAEVAEIRRVEQQFVRAELAGNIDSVLALRTPDIVWLAPNAPFLAGKPAIRGFLEKSGIRLTSFEVTPLWTEGRGDLAYNRGKYASAAVAGGDTTKETGKYLQIWRRQDDGSWRIAVDIWNTDSPPPPTVTPRRR